MKAEAPDFHAFSVDFIDEANPLNSIKGEPMVTISPLYFSTFHITDQVQIQIGQTVENRLSVLAKSKHTLLYVKNKQ